MMNTGDTGGGSVVVVHDSEGRVVASAGPESFDMAQGTFKLWCRKYNAPGHKVTMRYVTYEITDVEEVMSYET